MTPRPALPSGPLARGRCALPGSDGSAKSLLSSQAMGLQKTTKGPCQTEASLRLFLVRVRLPAIVKGTRTLLTDLVLARKLHPGPKEAPRQRLLIMGLNLRLQIHPLAKNLQFLYQVHAKWSRTLGYQASTWLLGDDRGG